MPYKQQKTENLKWEIYTQNFKDGWNKKKLKNEKQKEKVVDEQIYWKRNNKCSQGKKSNAKFTY